MRQRLQVGAGVLGLALALGWLLSLATTRVVNWFVMTDELFYERLAISVAQTGSLLPRLHGELVSNVNQLYPILLSPVFGDANVPGSLAAAHRLNAFVMASSVIPVYLLARTTGVGRLVSIWVGGLAVAIPWIVLSSFLLSEVAAYPAFCWAVLALTVATRRRSAGADLAALAAIALAVLARAQLAALLVVLPVAIVSEALFAVSAQGRSGLDLVRSAASNILRTRRLLLAAYLLGIVVLVGAAVRGDAASLFGSYAVTAEGVGLDVGLLHFAAEHLAILALGTAILPFLLGVAWLADRARGSAPPNERAFAAVGCATVLVLALQVASFNDRFGAGQVKDRYLFYVVPVVLVGLAAALSARPWPRWWAFLVPTVVCVAGFASVQLPLYQKLNVDSPLAILNDELLRQSNSLGWAQVLLVLATLVGAGMLIESPVALPRRAVAVGVAVLATVVLPAQAVYAFDRLFAVDGTNGLPVTLDQGGVFNWIDRAVGSDGRVAMVRSPVNSPDFWAGVAYWWDVEFWNESVVEEFELGRGQPGPEPWLHEFDPTTGAAVRPADTQYLLVYGAEARFRLAGTTLKYDRGAYLTEPERPWRADWLTSGIHGDGWTRPHVPAVIRIFAKPDQQEPLRRFLTLSIGSPDPAEGRPLTISSNLERWEGSIPPDGVVDRLVTACVPPRAYAEVVVETPAVSDVYRDPTLGALTGELDRPVGVQLRSLALADETEPLERCGAA